MVWLFVLWFTALGEVNLDWIKKPLLNKLWFYMTSNASISCLEHRKAAAFTKPLLSPSHSHNKPDHIAHFQSPEGGGEELEGGSKYSSSNGTLTELVSICASQLFKETSADPLGIKNWQEVNFSQRLGSPKAMQNCSRKLLFPLPFSSTLEHCNPRYA